MHFPTWVDLKGQDSVPDTLHHVVSVLSVQHFQVKKCLSKFPKATENSLMIVINKHAVLPRSLKKIKGFIEFDRNEKCGEMGASAISPICILAFSVLNMLH